MPSVPGYVHPPGHHCGSTALRNLLAFHGVEISEEMAFGLGAGACFYYVTLEDASPSPLVQRPHRALEENFNELTGAALRAAHLRAGRRRRLGGGARGGRRRQPRPPAHRPLLPRPLRQLGPLPRPRRGPRRLRRRGGAPLRHRLRGAADDCASRTSTGRATAATRPIRSPATCSPPPAASPQSSCARRSRLRSSAPPPRWSSPSSASSPASTPSAASPRRPGRGPRSPRTGSGAPASATR